jgi:hypothetical protein
MAEMAVSYNLLVRCDRAGQPYWEMKWRDGGRQLKRRLGAAWLVADGQGRWERRPGRPRANVLDERRAHAAAVETIALVATELAERERLERERANRPVTVRELAHEWLRWLEDVRQVKPATLRDYGALLREPGIPFKRGTRVTHGRLMGAHGDCSIKQLRTRGVPARARRREAQRAQRQQAPPVLAAIFQYPCREDTHGLEVNRSWPPTSARSHRPRRSTTTSFTMSKRWPTSRPPASIATACATTSIAASTSRRRVHLDPVLHRPAAGGRR